MRHFFLPREVNEPDSPFHHKSTVNSTFFHCILECKYAYTWCVCIEYIYIYKYIYIYINHTFSRLASRLMAGWLAVVAGSADRGAQGGRGLRSEV